MAIVTVAAVVTFVTIVTFIIVVTLMTTMMLVAIMTLVAIMAVVAIVTLVAIVEYHCTDYIVPSASCGWCHAESITWFVSRILLCGIALYNCIMRIVLCKLYHEYWIVRLYSSQWSSLWDLGTPITSWSYKKGEIDYSQLLSSGPYALVHKQEGMIYQKPTFSYIA